MRSYRCWFFLFPVVLASTGALPSALQAQDMRSADQESVGERFEVSPLESDALPLEAARTAEFTTSEGSWMSVDVAPDGGSLVFDLLGDLYLLPMDGGEAEPLTRGMAYDVQPRFSPDGERIVFVSDRSGAQNLWTVAVDGSDPRQITQGDQHAYTSPEWTPDGDYIVASRFSGIMGEAQLWLFHRDGGSGLQLIEEQGNAKRLGAAFGPDGRHVWHAERQGDWDYNAAFPEYQLARYDRDTGQNTTMTDRYGSAFRPVVSPDGRWLVYGTRHESETGLRIRDLETGDERWLVFPVQRDEKESRATTDVLPGMAFTPDSRHLITFFDGGLWRVPVEGEATPEPIPFEAEVKLEMGPEVRFDYPVDDSPTFHASQIRDGVPSPDGDLLAFTAVNRLYVMELPDGEPRRVTSLDAGHFHPSWSPDGEHLAFVTWDDADGGHLWRVEVGDEPRSPTRLSDAPAAFHDPVWSPDGERVVVARAAARDLQEHTGMFSGGLDTRFVWVPAAGGEMEEIGPAEGRRRPHFAGDASRIYSSGPMGLVSTRWDGTDERHHLQVMGAPAPGGGQPMPASLTMMAPKGEWAVAQVGLQLYAVTVPEVGDAPVTVPVANPANAPVPVRRLTRTGGQFPEWSADAQRIHFSLADAHFVYDLEEARAFEERMEAEREEPEEVEDPPDPEEVEDEDEDSPPGEAEPQEPERYEPQEHRVHVPVRRDLHDATLLLRGARILTMAEPGEVIEEGEILVEGNRIAGVGPVGSLDAPDGAEVRDVSGRTIIPGMVDTHYHAQWLVPEIHTSEVWQYPATLAYGVTTTRDPQTGTTDILTYQDRVESGDMIGPRIFHTGPGLGANENVRDADHAREVVERYADYFGTETLKMYMAGNREQRQWIVEAARELEIMPTTEGGLDFRANLTHAMDGYSGLEHSLPVTPLFQDVRRLFLESGITYTPTLLVAYGGPFGQDYFFTRENVAEDEKLRRFTPRRELDPKVRRRGSQFGPSGWFHEDEHVFPQQAEFVRDLVEAGGRAGVGAHGELQGLGNHWELWAIQSGGMDEYDALRVATILGAEGIGRAQDLGSIAEGKLADLVVLEDDPLEDIRNTNTIRYVMKGGRLYDGDTLDELHPRERPFPTPPWRQWDPERRSGAP